MTRRINEISRSFPFLQGIPNDGHFTSLDDIVTTCTSLVFTCSVQHAAVNFAQYDICRGETNWGRPPRPLFCPVAPSTVRWSDRQGARTCTHRCVSAGPRAWVIYGSRMRRHYVMAPPLLTNTINTRAPGARGSNWVQFDWDSSEPLWWSADRCSPDEI